MPRARALRHAILFRGAFLESLETPVFAWLLFGPEHRALSRIDRRFLSLVAASERSIDTSSRHSREKRPAESRRVCFLCQRPRIIDTSPVREPKKEERKKRERPGMGKREKSFYRSASRKRRSYNRHGHPRPYIPASRIVSRRKPHTYDARRCVLVIRTCTPGGRRIHTRELTRIATSHSNVMLLIWYCRRSRLMVSSRGPSID